MAEHLLDHLHVRGSAKGTKGRAMSWCTAGDLFCQGNWGRYSTALTIHGTSYASKDHYSAIGGWIVSKL